MIKLVSRSLTLLLVTSVASSMVGTTTFAQTTEATVILNSGSSVRGSITSVEPQGISVKTSRGVQELSVDDIRQVKAKEQPSWLTTAKTRYRESRYDNCYEAFSRNQLETTNRIVVQEAKYFEAMAAAELALSGGKVTAKTAGNLLLSFINDNTDSFHLYPATEKFADLAAASGGFKRAVEYYEKLQNAESKEYRSRSKLKLGKSKLYAGDTAGALKILSEVEKEDSSNENTKLIARCLLAQAMSGNNKTDEAIEILNNLIKNESSTQTSLFARANNALGICYLAKDDLKAARTAFMHTQLLFFTDRDAHAEALFHLHEISNKLQDSERTAQTRQLLKTRYRNTYWASKL